MNEAKKQVSRGMRKATKVQSVEEEYNIKLSSTNRSNMNLSTYVERSGLPQMARLFKKIESSQSNNNTPTK